MKRIFTLLSTALLFLVFSTASKAQIFVKLVDGSGNTINGESTDAKHPNEINATTFGQENTGCAGNVGSGSGGGASCGGTAGHFIFNMNVNASLPLLDQAVFAGTHLRSADIVFRKATQEYYTIHLESVMISHVTNSVDPTTGAIAVQVELAADKMGWTYNPQKADGAPGTPVKFGWDATTRSAWSF
ncbi:MAG TPA: type VI secretion system tube protein Hcp [Puia sp.]|jgi:type VI secretion system Hcp family effector